MIKAPKVHASILAGTKLSCHPYPVASATHLRRVVIVMPSAVKLRFNFNQPKKDNEVTSVKNSHV